MNREEALKLQSEGKPCYYTGQLKYLQGKRLYIKRVTSREVIVSSTPFLSTPEKDDYHQIRFKNLTPAE
jgi:hypothetical protein